MKNAFHFAVTLALTAFIGCAAEESDSEILNDMPTPSEAAQTVNDNPTAPTIDVPNTPVDEADKAKQDMPEEATPPAEPEKDADPATPDVVSDPASPTSEAKDAEADKKEAEAPK